MNSICLSSGRTDSVAARHVSDDIITFVSKKGDNDWFVMENDLNHDEIITVPSLMAVQQASPFKVRAHLQAPRSAQLDAKFRHAQSVTRRLQSLQRGLVADDDDKLFSTKHTNQDK